MSILVLHDISAGRYINYGLMEVSTPAYNGTITPFFLLIWQTTVLGILTTRVPLQLK